MKARERSEIVEWHRLYLKVGTLKRTGRILSLSPSVLCKHFDRHELPTYPSYMKDRPQGDGSEDIAPVPPVFVDKSQLLRCGSCEILIGSGGLCGWCIDEGVMQAG